MDDGGGVAGRRPGGGGAGDHSKSIISSIMLRFRPIVPKPADGDPLSGAFPAEGVGGAAARRRVKRKYRVRVRRKNIAPDGDNGRSDDVVVTGGGTRSGAADTTGALQLLPVRGEEDGHRQIGDKAAGAWPDRAVVESRVTVEAVGGACMGAGEGGVGGVGGLELDTCPAFVTDSRLSRVQWLNAAYVALVTGGEGEAAGAEVRVEMAAKEELPWWSGAFTCQARVEHTWRAVRYSKLVPCDVWRLESGGFAWRLDVKAALSLGF